MTRYTISMAIYVIFTSSFFLAWSESILTILKWTGLWPKVLLPVDFHTEGEHDNQMQVWITKFVLFLCKKLQWKKLTPTLCYCWVCHAVWRGSHSNISFVNEYFFFQQEKNKVEPLRGKKKKNPANNPQGVFFFSQCSCFHLLRLLGFLCLGNLDIKSKSE